MRTLPFFISLPADSPKSLCMLRAEAGRMCISGASPISSGHPRERYAKVAYAGRRGRVELPGEHLWNANRGPEPSGSKGANAHSSLQVSDSPGAQARVEACGAVCNWIGRQPCRRRAECRAAGLTQTIPLPEVSGRLDHLA